MLNPCLKFNGKGRYNSEKFKIQQQQKTYRKKGPTKFNISWILVQTHVNTK